MMRERKREQRHKKTALYYYIAFVVIAFLGTGSALYLKGGVPLVKEGTPIFMKIAGVMLLLLFSIVLYYTNGKRKYKIAGIIGILLLAGVFSWFASGISNEIMLKPQTLDTPETEFKRYDIQNGHFTVKEPNPNIVKEIDVDSLRNVVIHFSKPIQQEIAIKVLYTNEKEESFDKEKKINVKAEKGDKEVIVPINQANVNKIKIIIGKKIGVQFDFGSIEINGNYKERIQEKGKETEFNLYFYGIHGK